jgi:hypothetical protein
VTGVVSEKELGFRHVKFEMVTLEMSVKIERIQGLSLAVLPWIEMRMLKRT